MRTELLDRVRARVAKFGAEQDAGLVLSVEALDELHALMTAVPEPGADLEVLETAGWLHWCRYLVLDEPDDQADRDEALALFAAVYQQRPDAIPDNVRDYFTARPPDEPDSRGAIATAQQFLNQAERTGDMAALDTAAVMLQRSLAVTPVGHPDRIARLSDLAGAMVSRFELGRSPADLDRAVELDEQVLAATPAGDPEEGGRMSNLGSDLSRRYEVNGSVTDLDRAIEIGEQSLAATSADHPWRGARLTNLGASYQRRAERTHSLTDVRRAVELAEEALAAVPADHPYRTPRPNPQRAGRLSNLSAALRLSFENSGSQEDLDRAVETARQAVATAPDDDRHRAGYLHNVELAMRLQTGATAHPTPTEAP
jgi:tetratricopeptide (TPR) repeat protein